ncbi:MAG: D-alanine--D-alanine ligase family protein [bacterium]
MIVGITYDLREEYLAEGYDMEETAEFDKPETIDAIESALRQEGFETERIGHVKNLMGRLVRGERWDLVFNIAEGVRGFGREAQVPCLLDAYDIPYTFSDPLVLSLTLHKGMCKRVIRDLDIPTPAFAIVASEADAARVGLPFPLFVKPVAEGTGKGISASSKVHDRRALAAACNELLARYRQPVLVETYLPGREFTAGIIGTGKEGKVIGIMEIIFGENAEQGSYSFFNKEHYEDVVEYRMVDDPMAVRAGQMALAVWQGFGCRDAGRVDLRADVRGIPHVLEVNPLAGLNPEHSDLPILCRKKGMTFRWLIDSIMQSALKRVDRAPTLITEDAGGAGGPDIPMGSTQ